MSRYVEVPLAALEGMLRQCGFTRSPVRGEVTYQREVPSPEGARGLRKVLVYTSVGSGEDVARARGEDAIRVAVVWEEPQTGLRCGLGHERVLRTGTVDKVLGRMRDRMREGWAFARSLRVCRDCGAPAYPDSGRCVVRECRERGGRAA